MILILEKLIFFVTVSINTQKRQFNPHYSHFLISKLYSIYAYLF